MSPALLGSRLLVELPFVAFVVLLPFVGRGPDVDVLGVSMSRAGLILAGSIVCKATLAVLATGMLAATTSPAAIVGGLGRLRVPAIVTSIAALALRYVQLAFEDLARSKRARIARGDDPRWLWQARATARGFGGLAARSLARGERVHAAMLARGFDGRVPVLTLSAAGHDGRVGGGGGGAAARAGGDGIRDRRDAMTAIATRWRADRPGAAGRRARQPRRRTGSRSSGRWPRRSATPPGRSRSTSG